MRFMGWCFMREVDYNALSNVMMHAVRDAAHGVLRDIGEIENIQRRHKGLRSYTTHAWQRVAKSLVEALSRARPAFGLVIRGQPYRKGEAQDEWIIDPINGFTNFCRGVAHCALSVACRHGEDIVACVLYDVVRGELFRAVKGRGSFCESKRIRMERGRPWPESMLAMGGASMLSMARLSQQTPSTAPSPVMPHLRHTGADAIDMAWSACGRYDGYVGVCVPFASVASGMLLVREAGGLVHMSPVSSSQYARHRSSHLRERGAYCTIVAGTPECYRRVMDMMATMD